MPAPPNPNRRRRNARIPGIQLPAGGRQGPPPGWPLGSAVKAEREMWEQLWSLPQAVAWEQLSYLRAVARYVRLAVQAEKRDAPVTLAGEVRQLEDRLGLTPMSMKRLEWSIVGSVEEVRSAEVTDLDDFRSRLG